MCQQRLSRAYLPSIACPGYRLHILQLRACCSQMSEQLCTGCACRPAMGLRLRCCVVLLAALTASSVLVCNATYEAQAQYTCECSLRTYSSQPAINCVILLQEQPQVDIVHLSCTAASLVLR
jgi:hypothetical protein